MDWKLSLKPSDYSHIPVCEAALVDSEVFKTFKSNEQYREILSHMSYQQGMAYLILAAFEYQCVFDNLPWNRIRENDLIGGPVMYDYSSILSGGFTWEHFQLCPTTLRYVYTGLSILHHYMNVCNKTSARILEVGGGYGGQYKILSDLAPVLDIEIESYTIIDLRAASRLQVKYLQHWHLPLTAIEYEDFNPVTFSNDFDLLIANFSISEFHTEAREMYLKYVVPRCSNCYIIWNTPQIPEDFHTGLHFIENERPLTGKFNRLIRNIIPMRKIPFTATTMCT